jgi:hypothetical protein
MFLKGKELDFLLVNMCSIPVVIKHNLLTNTKQNLPLVKSSLFQEPSGSYDKTKDELVIFLVPDKEVESKVKEYLRHTEKKHRVYNFSFLI